MQYAQPVLDPNQFHRKHRPSMLTGCTKNNTNL
nr:MAG TPA: hypothetical protein [Caudoviricetes sp.]